MLTCSYCNKEFKYESEKKRHELSHIPQFECKDCYKKFSFVSALRRHQKQHNRIGSVQCNECSRKFRDSTLLLRHIKYAHKGIHVCPKCSAKYSSEIALSNHLKTHKPKSERKFKCKYTNCDKTFNFVHHLKHHEQTHSKLKEYFCNTCGKGFIQAHHLKTHLKSHEPENWLPCNIPNCKKTFPTQAALKRHLNVHVTVLCPTCGQLVSLASFEKHVSKCMSHKQEEPEDLSLIAKSSSKTDFINKDSITKSVLGDWDISENNLSLISNRHIEALGFSDNPILNNNNSLEIYRSLEYTNLPQSNILSNKCNDCNCFSNKICDFGSRNKQNIVSEEFPNLEYKVDGTIKLKETFDLDFGMRSDEEIRNKLSVEYNSSFKNIVVPFSSCKDVLGKCIVSGNGTISEECLCAKMAMDDQQNIAQEIDEITPKPTVILT